MNILCVDNIAAMLSFKSGEKEINSVPFEAISETYNEGLDQLAEAIIAQNCDIIFIQTLLKVQNRHFQDMSGIELLKWLRLKGATQHIVLFGSILTATELVQYKPEFLIVTSQGVTVIPENFDFGVLSNFSELKPFSKETQGYLLPYIKVEFSMPEDERHNWANWWGIKKLCDVHYQKNPVYPEKVKVHLKELRSQQAIYLYEAEKYGNITYVPDQHKIDLQNRKPKILYIDDQAEDGWQDIFSLMFYDLEIKNNDYLKVYQPKSNENEEDIVAKAFDLFVNDMPDVVLLDLRLKREAGTIQDVENLSGAKVLDIIRKMYLGLPVIMVTASNKARSIEALEKLGCDAFWIKEGLDANMSFSESVDNYFKLIRLVERTTGEEYQFLKRLGEKVKEFANQNTTFWWENMTWNVKRTDRRNNTVFKSITYTSVTSRTSTISKIKNISSFIRLFFKAEILSTGNQNIDYKQSLIAGTLSELCKIIEEVHRDNKNPHNQYNNVDAGGYHDKQSKKWIREHNGDFLAYYLYLLRNSNMHFNHNPVKNVFDIQKLMFFIACFFSWLSSKFIVIQLQDLDTKLDPNDVSLIENNIRFFLQNPTYSHIKQEIKELYPSI